MWYDYTKVQGRGCAFKPHAGDKSAYTFEPGDATRYTVKMWMTDGGQIYTIAYVGIDPTDYGGAVVANYGDAVPFGRCASDQGTGPYSRAVCEFACRVVMDEEPEEPPQLACRRDPPSTTPQET